jgi:basic membrane protein A
MSTKRIWSTSQLVNWSFRFFWAACAFVLAACSNPSPTSTPPIPSLTTPATAAPDETASPRPAQATATEAPSKVAYVVEAPAGAATPMLVALQNAAQEFGWEVEAAGAASAETIQASAQSASVVVVDGAAWWDATRAAALEFPNVYFVSAPDQRTEADLPPNLLALGGPGSRQDQAGFLAGMVAGYATETQRVAVVSDVVSPVGLKYRNGFYHGVLYACPRCRVDFVDVFNLSDTTTASAGITNLVIFGTDVVFAAPGEAGDAALVAAAQKGAWVIGSSAEASTTLSGDGTVVLTRAYLDAAAAVYAALVAFHDGAPPHGELPLSAAGGALSLAPYHDPEGLLTAPELATIAEAQTRLADGSLETGIDPATGEER